MNTAAVHEAERLLGHAFARPELLAEALTHPSALGSMKQGRRRVRRGAPPKNYERLEWLGDRVLNLAIADLLWQRFPEEPEGHLTVRYANLVNEQSLAKIAQEIGLGPHLASSPSGSAAGIATHPAVLADACEAVIAAVYLDGGFSAAVALVQRLWAPLIDAMTTLPRSAKTQLQEWSQGRGLGFPEYVVVDTSGPPHALQFTVDAKVTGFPAMSSTASSKQRAEEQAAERLLQTLPASLPRSVNRRKK